MAACRLGISTLQEKWTQWLGQPVALHTTPILQLLYPLALQTDNYWINGGLVPDPSLIEALQALPEETALVADDQLLISRSARFPSDQKLQQQPYSKPYTLIRYPWDLIRQNGTAIRADFQQLARRTAPPVLGTDVRLIDRENVFIEKGAAVLCSTLNASTGPIYIGKNALIMEGCHIRGPFALGEGAVVKMGARIYGGTTIGPYSVAGGEINNSIIFGYTNKAHDGYLGDSVLGEWCNWGAGTSCSNLKNTAGPQYVQVGAERVAIGLKCGVMMGDFSRTAIHTRINSGTRVGVSAHLFGTGFPPKDVPSFYWNDTERYQLDKALQDANNWMQLKGKALSAAQRAVLTHIFQQTV